jgi:hypothetical protein
MNVPIKQRILTKAKITLVYPLQDLSDDLKVSKHLLELYIKQLNAEGENIYALKGYVKYNPGLIEKVRDKVWS